MLELLRKVPNQLEVNVIEVVAIPCLCEARFGPCSEYNVDLGSTTAMYVFGYSACRKASKHQRTTINSTHLCERNDSAFADVGLTVVGTFN